MERLSAHELAQLRAELEQIAARTPRFQVMPKNTDGRDFVIGDVHGAFDEVWKAMQAAGFNRNTDRLFSVGDLIDRGSGSARAGRFLDQPYVYAIPGNHEAELVEIYLEQDDPCAVLEAVSRINFNGMGWLQATSAKERADLIKRFAALPLAREIHTERGTVGIVHGEVPRGMDWQTFTSSITAGNKEVIESCLQGRTRLKTKDDSGVPGVGRLFAGHTPLFDGAARLGNVYAVDTGAVFAELTGRPGAAMTFADLSFKTGSLTQPRVDGNVRVLDDATESAFGEYAAPRF